MIFLTKLKAAAASAVAVLVVAGAVGPGLRPAVAQDDAAPAAKAGPKASPDAAFLDRICLELRGSKATPVEHVYFAADADADKRHKVTNWLLADPRVKAHLAGGKAHDFAVWLNEQNFETTADGEFREVTLSAAGNDLTAKAVAFSPDGKRVAVERSGGKTEPTVVGVVNRLIRGESKDGLVEVEIDAGLPAAAAERVERVFLGADVVPTKTAEPKPGEPVRVRVVVAEDDGKGGVKYKVQERQVVPAKAADGKEPAPQTFFYKLATPPDGAAPGTFLYRVAPSGQVEKVEGKAVVRDDVLLFAQPKGAPATKTTAADGAIRIWDASAKETDAAFLRRAVTEARGTPPTALEERYFAADPDPRKREKLLDALLSDPAALRRVGDGWKRRMLAPPTAARPQVVPFTAEGTADLFLPYLKAQPKAADGVLRPYLFVEPKGGMREVVPLPPAKDVLVPKGRVEIELTTPPAGKAVAPKAGLFVQPLDKDVVEEKVVTPPATVTKAATARLVAASADRWQRLVADLISVGKTDEQILEALTLAAAGRLPTDVERRLTLATVPAAGDRAAAWAAVARALAGPAAVAPVAPLPKSKQ